MKTRSSGAHSGSLNKTLVARARNLGASGDRAPVRQQPCACYFSPFADIRKEDVNKVQGSFNTWHPWKYSERVRVVAAVEKKKAELSKSTLKPTTKREKISFFAQ